MKLFRGRLLLPLVVSCLGIALLVTLVGFAHYRTAAAAGAYATNATGYDVSYPQCSSALPPAPFGFGIVGTTGGRAFTANSCLAREYGWAAGGTAETPSLYMNLNYPVGSTASHGKTGPAGSCAKSNTACYAYNYGYNAASYAVSLATSDGASSAMWWLDIETGNSWSKTTALNDDVIEGAVDYLQQQAGATVGIYSTAGMWASIAGATFQPGTIPLPGTSTHVGTPVVANWVPGGSSTSCAGVAPLYPGGSVWLAQYSSSPYDADYSC